MLGIICTYCGVRAHPGIIPKSHLIGIMRSHDIGVSQRIQNIPHQPNVFGLNDIRLKFLNDFLESKFQKIDVALEFRLSHVFEGPSHPKVSRIGVGNNQRECRKIDTLKFDGKLDDVIEFWIPIIFICIRGRQSEIGKDDLNLMP